MAKLEFTGAEVGVLRELLQGDLARLLLEISHTDHREMRDGLKRREELIDGIVRKLGPVG